MYNIRNQQNSRKNLGKINETKSTFFERITKINKNLAIVVKGKVGKDPQTTNDRIKKQDLIRETICIEMIIKNYCEKIKQTQQLR